MAEVTVTTEQVHELIQQLAAMNVAASITPDIVANIFEKIRNLNDQEREKVIAVAESFIARLLRIGIGSEATESEIDDIRIETDGGTLVVKIDANGADFADLKRGGNQVATINQLPTRDTSIGDTPSNTHVPTTKAVKEYVDANAMGDLPISKDSTQSEDEEFVASNDAGTDTYAKIGPYGVKAKAYLDMHGNSVIPVKDTSIGDTPSQAHVPTSKAVADYVEAHGGGVGNLPISKELTVSDEEEQVWCSDDGSDEYAKITPEGIFGKAFFNQKGEKIESGSSEYKEKMYVAAGDSITEGAGLRRQEDTISNDDPYCPVAGTKKKSYPYYIAKYHGLKWVNQGFSGSTLGDVTFNGTDKRGFSKANGRYTQLPVNIDYISIWFGWNDDYYGPLMKREEWLLATYGTKIYYPTNTSLIGTTHTDGTPYTTQEQYEACNAVTGSVDGTAYTDNGKYFYALYIGTPSDSTNKTWWGAWNIVLPYLIEKYPFTKILLITGYGANSIMWDSVIDVAKKYGVDFLDLSASGMNFINVRNASLEGNGQVYYDSNKYTDRNVYASYNSGNVDTKTFRKRTLLYDGTHPNFQGYKYLYNRVSDKLLNC